NDTSIFYTNDNGTIFSDPANPILTFPGCTQLCGTGRSWYPDPGPRVSTWLIPVVLLVSNMEVSPLDKRRYLMLLHLLGDPINSLWALLLKMEAWSRCFSMARTARKDNSDLGTRNFATVLGGIEELSGFHADPQLVYTSITSRSTLNSDQLDHIIGKAAQELANSRTDERLRTLLAAALYFWQVVSAFVTTIGGGNTSPPGGRIGIAMFMTWIIPTILLSNAIGTFTSCRVCFDILERFVKEVTGHSNLWVHLQDASPSLQQFGSLDEYLNSLAWSGAIYTYRPATNLPYSTSSKDRSRFLLLALAISPLIISTVASTLILWHTPPIGVNCRNMLVFIIFMFFCLSAACTWSIHRLRKFMWIDIGGAAHWHLTLMKDALVAIPFVVLIFLSTCGLFNSCWCWSGPYSLGGKKRVPLNHIPQLNRDFKSTYPIIVVGCLVLECVVFVAMMWIGWNGWVTMRWSEKAKMEEWRRV
ncbi:hypothetical protein CC78DRAFT_439446, partial [Lojkania enalia]